MKGIPHGIPLIPELRQQEDQHLGMLPLVHHDFRLAGQFERVARSQFAAVDDNGAARDMDIGPPPLLDRKPGLLAAVENPGVQHRLLVDHHRAVTPVRRGDQAKPAALLLGREVLLLVRRRDTAPIRLDGGSA